MPATIEALDNEALEERVRALGRQIRMRRKALGVTAMAAAEAAGMSRVTWHRIEKGETSVTIAAWFNALAVLGLEFGIGMQGQDDAASSTKEVLPLRIRLDRYPQLAALAWQVPGERELAPREAWDIYRRNYRHLDPKALGEAERALVGALEDVFGALADDV